MILSIVVITMNRAEQLRSALFSCISSDLPREVEFIIIDNASSDNTESVVRGFFASNKYHYVYEKEIDNLGVGGGRNRGFELAQGDIVYFLDDDAIVSSDSYSSFFKLPISLFQQDASIATITTRIYDELLKSDRVVQCTKKRTHLPEIFMFLGGSHFLRKSYFETPLYLDIKYGMEELLPSIYAINSGFKNCYVPQLTIFHRPIRNKWKPGDSENSIIINYNVNNYITKRLIYPSFLGPLLRFAFYCRTLRYFGLNLKMWRKTISELRCQQQKIQRSLPRIKLKTVYSLIKDYSLGTAF